MREGAGEGGRAFKPLFGMKPVKGKRKGKASDDCSGKVSACAKGSPQAEVASYRAAAALLGALVLPLSYCFVLDMSLGASRSPSVKKYHRNARCTLLSVFAICNFVFTCL